LLIYKTELAASVTEYATYTLAKELSLGASLAKCLMHWLRHIEILIDISVLELDLECAGFSLVAEPRDIA